ncbi:hypothetical protein A2U01_0113698 [Trifolium medium]|uniref:Uncharacterized protein n=1 Tax=Trifolium medium TaxID=97028 RepID=A0A392VY52_9FABA|nr:hypothetical protein [Trifolium medium]
MKDIDRVRGDNPTHEEEMQSVVEADAQMTR